MYLGQNLQYVARGCFLAGTLIGTPDGDKPIEELVAGDSVISFNEETGLEEISVIGYIDVLERDSYYTINGIVNVTAEHPFYTTTGIKEVQKINHKTVLKGRYNTDVKVGSIAKTDDTVTVYNLLDVTPNNNYFASNLLVHNKGGGCFLGDTKITTPEGRKAINRLNVGEIVISNNEITGKDGYSTIEYIDVLKVWGYYRINGKLKVTGTHPIYTSDNGKVVIKPVSLLQAGDLLITDAGTEIISKIEFFEKEVTVYNLLNVEPNHNYYAENILVHNKGGGGARSSGGYRSSSSGSKSSSSTSTTSNKSTSRTTSSAKTTPGSKVTVGGKQVQTSSKKPTNPNVNQAGITGVDNYSPRFTNGYSAPAGSVVYYPQHSFIDYLPWVYLFGMGGDTPTDDKTIIMQPDGKEVQAQPVQEGIDGLAVFNWILLIAIVIAIISGIIWGVNKLTSKE